VTSRGGELFSHSERKAPPEAPGGSGARPGVVYLVGAGPGDPGLMTARSLELIASADVILHDRLVPSGALAGARSGADLVYVGKRPGSEEVSQREIEELLIDRARVGLSVVRLKGGDPFVFGRGGEEAEALAAAGVEFEVLPGVTAGVAAPAYAGIPITHRDSASAVAFVTGHEDPAKGDSTLDWQALARFPGTLVFYMAVKRLPEIAASLISAGRDPAEGAAAIERGTMPGQRTVAAPLRELPAAVADAGLKPPAILVVGPVAERREAIAWLERRPLHGRRVVVTRARAQASGLAGKLRALGAEVVELPAIRIEQRIDTAEVRDAIHDLHSYALVCLTSPNGVRLLFEAMAAQGRDARALANAVVAAIGPGTAAALAERGVIADLVPERFVAEGLVEALSEVDVAHRPVLVARAAEARDVLPNALRERGAQVDVVALYETVAEDPEPAAVAAAQAADYVTFTSSSTVRNLLAAIGDRFPRAARVVSIGPVTSEAARGAGLEVHVESSRHEPDGLVEALLADAVR
jgi:uroporphyrinogen III methyltransferase / synthase